MEVLNDGVSEWGSGARPGSVSVMRKQRRDLSPLNVNCQNKRSTRGTNDADRIRPLNGSDSVTHRAFGGCTAA